MKKRIERLFVSSDISSVLTCFREKLMKKRIESK